MGKAIVVVLGNTKFDTLGAASKYFSSMLWRYKVGDVVSGDDSILLAELLKRHPEFSAKVGIGVRNFEVIDDKMGGQCFAVRRVDDSCEDFSYKSCVSEGRYK